MNMNANRLTDMPTHDENIQALMKAWSVSSGRPQLLNAASLIITSNMHLEYFLKRFSFEGLLALRRILLLMFESDAIASDKNHRVTKRGAPTEAISH